jgi:type I site-specific restriction endonuclease
MFLSGTGKGIRESSHDYLPPPGPEGSRAFADYVLLGKDGEPLAVLEAKRDSRSPLEGEYQAIEYGSALTSRLANSRLFSSLMETKRIS